MKKIILCLAACAIVTGFMSCKPPIIGGCGDDIIIPAHNPIDRENYNNVYTVFWNYFDNECYDSVLMCGYVGYDKYNDRVVFPVRLYDDSIKALDCTTYTGGDFFKQVVVNITWADSISDQIKSIINNSIPNKCYIKGFVYHQYELFYGLCYYHHLPKLYIKNVEDIYFKND